MGKIKTTNLINQFKIGQKYQVSINGTLLNGGYIERVYIDASLNRLVIELVGQSDVEHLFYDKIKYVNKLNNLLQVVHDDYSTTEIVLYNR